MEQELRLPYDRKLSEAVWRRVLPEVSPFDPLSEPDETACCMAAPPEDGLARLRRLIDEEVSMARAYRCHARSAPPAARRVPNRRWVVELEGLPKAIPPYCTCCGLPTQETELLEYQPDQKG